MRHPRWAIADLDIRRTFDIFEQVLDYRQLGEMHWLARDLGKIVVPFGRYADRPVADIPMDYLDRTLSVMQPTFLIRRAIEYVDLLHRLGAYEFGYAAFQSRVYQGTGSELLELLKDQWQPRTNAGAAVDGVGDRVAEPVQQDHATN